MSHDDPLLKKLAAVGDELMAELDRIDNKYRARRIGDDERELLRRRALAKFVERTNQKLDEDQRRALQEWASPAKQ